MYCACSSTVGLARVGVGTAVSSAGDCNISSTCEATGSAEGSTIWKPGGGGGMSGVTDGAVGATWACPSPCSTKPGGGGGIVLGITLPPHAIAHQRRQHARRYWG